MQFTKQAAMLIRDTVRADPPGVGEYIRIEGMGNMWLTPIESPADDTFLELMVVQIDDAEYRIGRRGA